MIKANFMTFDVDADRQVSFPEDMLIQMHIPKKVRDRDLALYETKWFDYRRMTPMQATMQYVRDYETTYRAIYARELDRERAAHLKLPTPESIIVGLQRNASSGKRKLTGFWKGRQVADALGMPYHLYLEYAFSYRMRRWQRTYMPQPGQLYHEYDVEKIVARWEEQQAGRLYLPEDPAYLVQNYQEIPYQKDFHEWLFAQARLRGDEAWTLATLIQRDFLPVDKVAKRVEPMVYERIERYLQ